MKGEEVKENYYSPIFQILGKGLLLKRKVVEVLS